MPSSESLSIIIFRFSSFFNNSFRKSVYFVFDNKINNFIYSNRRNKFD